MNAALPLGDPGTPARTLRCRDLNVSIGALTLVADLNLSIEPGSFVGLLGCNGAGKSSLLRVLAGLDAAAGGEVGIDSTPIASMPRRALAQALGMLLQDDVGGLPVTVAERVLMGRHPHLGFWDWETEADLGIVAAALRQVDLGGFEDRLSDTLSGGEWRRVCIAALLAQQPGIYLLDEPLNHLDPRHRRDLMRICAALAQAGRALIASFHDAAQVARYCDHALLLFGPAARGEWLYGAVEDVLTAGNLSRLYGLDTTELREAFSSTLRI